MRLHRPRPLRSRPSVSVVVPCYNYGRYLPDAVDSALRQADVDVEVLVVDDASTDDSAAVATSLARRDSRVDVLVHERNTGHIQAYNDGLTKVSGDYLVLLSADDALVDGSLARAVSLMQHHPRVGMVYGHSAAFTDTIPDTDGRARSWTTWAGADWLARMCRRAKNPVYTPGVVMRRAAWEQIGAYDARVPHAADMLLWFQTAVHWDIGRVNNEAQAVYRVHGSNMHLTQYAGMLRDLQEQREVVRILFEEPLGGRRPPRSLSVAAHRSLARRAGRLAAAELRDGGDEAAAAQFRRFAEETIALVPAAGPSRRTAALDRWLETPSGTLARKAQHNVEWRLWLRYGL